MTVRQMIDSILGELSGGAHIQSTCDIIASGDPNTEVTGIITTFMATVEVIRKSIELGANLIITHEPTWFNGNDQTDWCEQDRVYLAKKKLLEDNKIAIWRFHDHMHAGAGTDYIYTGLIAELGWEKHLSQNEQQPWIYELPETTLRELALELKTRLEMDTIQVIGKPDCLIRRAGILVGGGSLGLGREVMPMEVMERNDLNVLICGEITEWTTCAYINDAQQLGMERCMITLGHERSEEPGMKHLPMLLRRCIPGIPIHFVSAREPFVYY